ncbi:MAG: phosphonate ABC transporter, permease protein PhnE [Verrucomicrobiia bacterium]
MSGGRSDGGEGAPAEPQFPELPWYRRLNVLDVVLVIFLLAVVFSSGTLAGSGRPVNYWEGLSRVVGRFFPPDWSVAGTTVQALGETVQIAVMATFFSILISVPLAAAGARRLAPLILVGAVRMVMNGIRTIPSLIWAVIAVAVVGPNALAGVIALTLYSVGYLGKFFSDAFESVDLDVAEGLRAIGAGTIQAFQHGVWPHAKPLIWSSSLWMLEYNIRSAAIIGFVGAGGIGVQLHAYAEYGWWNKFATVLIFILVLVTMLDVLGEWVRKQVTKRIQRPLAR